MKLITVCIITKDQQDQIADVIESVGWADEIVVVDTGSSDMTPEIAKRMGARVVQTTKGSYDSWRNRGLKEAKSTWIFYVDSDERVTNQLKDEILSVLKVPRYDAYAIPRKNIVLGKELRYGGFGKDDYVKRLFKRSKLKKWTGEVHEEPNYLYRGKMTTGKNGELGHLKNKMLHIKAQSISEMVEKTNLWSEKEAKLMYEANHPTMNIYRFFSAAFREFWYRFVIKQAFRDGAIGIIHGLYQVYSRFISYAKLWELQIKN